jgi:hypothetical protein
MKTFSNTVRCFAGVACVLAVALMSACGDRLSPSSPSPLSMSAAGARSSGDALFDYHQDPYDPYPPDPMPGPAPDPSPVPTPGPGPSPLTISIVGSFGNGAFVPNPIQAAAGDMIVWTNKDRTLHNIVLSDGTVVGELAPGQSTGPISVTRATASYRCTIHSSMVGSITDVVAPGPAPAPAPEPPPPDDYFYSRR